MDKSEVVKAFADVSHSGCVEVSISFGDFSFSKEDVNLRFEEEGMSLVCEKEEEFRGVLHYEDIKRIEQDELIVRVLFKFRDVEGMLTVPKEGIWFI